jgi:hypothetical protein
VSARNGIPFPLLKTKYLLIDKIEGGFFNNISLTGLAIGMNLTFLDLVIKLPDPI